MRRRVDASFVSRIYMPALGAAVLALVACQEADTPIPSSPEESIAVTSHGSADMLFQARLAPVTSGQGAGVLLLEIHGGQLRAKVHAKGLEPFAVIPQHIHQAPTCAVASAVLVNLDAGLTVAGEGPGVGPDYPTANRAGVIHYDASRSLADLIDAVNDFQSAGVSTVEELLAYLDLENRNMHTHEPVSPFTPVACGPIDRIR